MPVRAPVRDSDAASVAEGEALKTTEALVDLLTVALGDSDAEGVEEPHSERLLVPLALSDALAEENGDVDVLALLAAVAVSVLVRKPERDEDGERLTRFDTDALLEMLEDVDTEMDDVPVGVAEAKDVREGGGLKVVETDREPEDVPVTDTATVFDAVVEADKLAFGERESDRDALALSGALALLHAVGEPVDADELEGAMAVPESVAEVSGVADAAVDALRVAVGGADMLSVAQ